MASEAKKDDKVPQEEQKDAIDMEYRMLGGTGLKVSALSFGFWATYGVKEGVDRCVSVMRICRKAGINLFDNAEAYGKEIGDAEAIMGIAYKKLQEEDAKLWRRSDVCFTTKLFWGGSGQNEKGLSRKHIAEGMDADLALWNGRPFAATSRVTGVVIDGAIVVDPR